MKTSAAPWCAALLLAQCVSAGQRPANDSASHAEAAAAISRGVAFLWRTQATAETELSSPRASFEGDWDQFMSFKVGPVRVAIHDTSPFIPTCVSQGLRHLSPENAAALGIRDEDCVKAREIRMRIVRLAQRFEKGDGTAAYWPDATAGPATLWQRLQAGTLRILHRGPALHGTLAPRGDASLPPEFRTWPDPDCTAMSWVARWINHQADGAAWQPVNAIDVLSPYAHVRKGNLYFPVHSVPPVGVYYGFCIPSDRPDIPKDVDLIVNCNILYAFALLADGDTPEAQRIIQWILEVVRQGPNREMADLTLYYRWNNVLPYVVSRCYKDGGIKSLAPAVKTLAAEVRAQAVQRSDGTVFWDGSNPVRATAFALLTLLNDEECGPLVEGATRWLMARQDSKTNGWHDHWVPLTQTTTGRVIYFRCDAAATSYAIEALSRYQLDCPPKRTFSKAARR